ncbi:PREDICTED: uncharacterized protein LOC106908850 [Poecilia mexicana]|uniref:uncharacterized protein LOC106908850 n=1 Tax=Poecilia mexicana TaxID=48701 RepID=UPI00072E265A|nr:PREDICTED: uncharacterized protein LOC106908850 [Poecilia mexicana]
MRSDAVDVGDFSLTLREPQLLDSGVYICSLRQETGEEMLSGIQLNVREIFPTWARIFLTLLILLPVSGGLLFHFRHYFMSVYRVEVDSGEESVLLPFKTAVRLPEGVRVRWRHNTGRMVYINDRGLNWYQHWLYKDRTEIKEKSTFGDFSLTLKKPTSRDTGTYSCTVYKDSSDEILTMKQVLLKVKAGPDSLIISIDFGSGFSGYAFNVKPRQEGGETQIKRWSDGLGLDTPKTPTCILFDEHEEFMKFGYEAKTAFNNMRGGEAEKHYFFEDFIMNLCDRVSLLHPAGPDSLIISIDFGSGFSGYAFNVKPRQEGGETQIKRWSDGLGLDTPKTPTCILFDEHEEFMKFGYEAKTAFNNMRGGEAEKHYFFENIKRWIRHIGDWTWVVFTANGKWMSTLKVFTEVLRFLKDDALKSIRSHPEGGEFTASDFTWVMTVPDTWKDFHKQFIIKSAVQAGLVTDATKDKLMFVLESEAALTWCLKLQPDGFITQNHSRDSQDQPAGAAEPDTSWNGTEWICNVWQTNINRF